jgi:hypothetical protein
VADKREQSPHYIPELDPENPESGPKVKQRLLWMLVIFGFAFTAIGGVLLSIGMQTAGLVFILIGVMLLAPILFWIPWF